MELPSLKKLFNITSTTAYEELRKRYGELQDEFANINKSYNNVLETNERTRIKLNETLQMCKSLTEENERLRKRLAKAGLQLTKLKTQLKKQERDDVDVVDEVEDTRVEVVKSGIARVSQIAKDIEINQEFAGTTVGHFIKTAMKMYKETPQGRKVCEVIESLEEGQILTLKRYFHQQYENFQIDQYNTVCVLAALYNNGWNYEDEAKIATRILKEMNAKASIAHALMICIPNNVRYRKSGGGKIAQFQQLMSYLVQNPNTDKPFRNLCKSLGVSVTTAHRFLYLALLFTENDNWSAEL